MGWVPIAEYDVAASGLVDKSGLAGALNLGGGASLQSDGVAFPAPGTYGRVPTPVLWTGGLMGRMRFRIQAPKAGQRQNLLEAGNAFAVFVDEKQILRVTYRHPSGTWIGTHLVDEAVPANTWNTVDWRLGTGKALLRLNAGAIWETESPGSVPAPPASGIVVGAWAGNVAQYPLRGEVGYLRLCAYLPDLHADGPRKTTTPMSAEALAALQTGFHPRVDLSREGAARALLGAVLDGGELPISAATRRRLGMELRTREGQRLMARLSDPCGPNATATGAALARLLLTSADAESREGLTRVVDLVYTKLGAARALAALPLFDALLGTIRRELGGTR